MLLTDYLVIGAGAASMAFVDTLLAEQPEASVIVVDKHSAPGGHWNDAYGFVRLHQPSLVYGVASSQLEGNWLKLLLTKGTLPWNHRATKEQLLAYYKQVMDKWVASGRVQYFPNCAFNFDSAKDNNEYSFRSLHDESEKYHVKVNVKLVNGVLNECRVPSKTPPAFSVDPTIQMWTPNQVHDHFESKPKTSFFRSKTDTKKYIVLGAGKTAMDTVVYLQRSGGVSPNNITWIIPNDVWIMAREGPGSPWSWSYALLENDLNVEAAALSLEQQGIFTRLDPNVMPTKFRFPLVGSDEIKLLRAVKHVIRGRGRVTKIESNGRVSFTKGDPLVLENVNNCVFVHCTSPGPFNGNTNINPFPDDKTIQLSFLYAPPVPISMSSLAVIESRRFAGTLDLEFGRKLLSCQDNNKNFSENDILETLITGYNITAKDDVTENLMDQVAPLKVLVHFMATFDQDPNVARGWLANNRLSFFSIPGFKGKVYETTLRILEKEKILDLSSQDVKMLSLVADKLKPLKGK